eukprot:Skav220065  [mRNA]  locus=scaffold1709:184330:188467:- [translate_table: standard]
MASPSAVSVEEAPVPPLQAVQTLRAEFDIFAARLRDKIVTLEKNLSRAVAATMWQLHHRSHVRSLLQTLLEARQLPLEVPP